MGRDLFLSILALDAYNQGYSAGTNGEGTDVGSATFLKEEIGQSAQNNGFYGIAYDWNGETIISFAAPIIMVCKGGSAQMVPALVI